VLEVRGLTVQLGTRTVLSGLSTSFGNGVTAIVGPNGAGKSTLLRVLAGTLKPRSGLVDWDGLRPYESSSALKEYHRTLGWVPQSVRLPGSFRVDQLLEHAAWLKAVPRQESTALIARARAATDIDRYRSQRIGRLSGGQQQRVLLAAALVNAPRLIILDEPTAGLDPEQRERFLSIVTSLGKSTCVVLATHHH